MTNILTLWDIDGNLVNIYKFHTPGYQKGMKDVFGVTIEPDKIERNYGQPANEVVAIPLREEGIPEDKIRKGVDKVLEIYVNELEKNIRSEKKNAILPGVNRLLNEFSERKIPMGIVTGNIKKAGEAILHATDIFKYFKPEINSYGDDAETRSDIVANAISSAKKNGIDFSQVFVFGDNPIDVVAAKANNCISIAVIKNSNTPDSSPGGTEYIKRKKELEEAKPDYLFDDYTDIEKIFSILFT